MPPHTTELTISEEPCLVVEDTGFDESPSNTVKEEKLKEDLLDTATPAMEAIDSSHPSETVNNDSEISETERIQDGHSRAQEFHRATGQPPNSERSRWGSFRNRVQTKFAQRKSNSTDKKDQSTPKVASTNLSRSEMESMRARHVSVTVVKGTQDSKLGFAIEPAPRRPANVRIAYMAPNLGLLQHAPFQEGDILKSINQEVCTNADWAIEKLVQFEAGIPITLQVETPKGNPDLAQAMVRKPTPSANLGIRFICQATTVDVEPAIEETKEEDTSEEEKASPADPTKVEENATVASTESNTDENVQKVLKIQELDPEGLFSKSTLQVGDWVLAINATPCSQLSVSEAEELLDQSSETVTIIAIRPPSKQTPTRAQRFLRQAKRAGIALGGGTMLGVGLIFIPTLPPPFGEVLIIGGVSVLGTEFEGPKRVMKSARDRLEQAVGRDEATGQREGKLDCEIESNNAPTSGECEQVADSKESIVLEGNDGENCDEAESKSTDASSQKVPNKTMQDRFKNFGRKVVLPFLDQVVGDRQEEGKEVTEKSTDASSSTPPLTNEETTAAINEATT